MALHYSSNGENAMTSDTFEREPDTNGTNRELNLVHAGLLCVLIPILYLNSITGEWHWDDFYTIVDNPYLRDLSWIPKYFTDARTFSVDPDRDTPEVLRGYGERYHADPQRWLFLTGAMDRIYDIAIEGFKITVEAARENNQIIHDTRFILVDAAGVIRGYYDSTSAEALERLRPDASAAAFETSP